MRFALFALGCALLAAGSLVLFDESLKVLRREQAHIEFAMVAGLSVGLGVACLTT